MTVLTDTSVILTVSVEALGPYGGCLDFKTFKYTLVKQEENNWVFNDFYILRLMQGT